MDQPTTLTGNIERVTYHNADNGYCVLKLRAHGTVDLITVVGHLANANSGICIESLGHWTEHRDFGPQFKATQIRVIQPSTAQEIEKYLSSGIVRGIGPHFAKKIVAAFGDKVFDVLDQNPESLLKIRGLGKGRAEQIAKDWKAQKVVREITFFLQSHGVSTGRALRIYKTYGPDSLRLVKENPYQLARDVIGIGFKSADQIAQSQGIPKDSLLRARAGIGFVLEEKTNQGHVAYPEKALLEGASELLEISPEILSQAVELEISEGHLIREEIFGATCLYPAALHYYEQEVAELLKDIMEGKTPWDQKIAEEKLSEVEQSLKITLAPLQKSALKMALQSKVMILTGGPGTGKTTITKAFLELLATQKIRVSLCSPTGRAAKRLSEITGREAKTIHRLLGVGEELAEEASTSSVKARSGFFHDRFNPLKTDLVLVDESSMIDLVLMYDLLKAVPAHAGVIFVGDIDQIPSVGPGSVLRSFIESEALPVARLSEIFRQSTQSQIVEAAHKINRGEMPEINTKDPASDFHFIASEDAELTTQKIIEIVKTRIPSRFGLDPLREVQVLCPMTKGTLGTRALGQALQKQLNGSSVVSFERFGYTYSVGDKIIVTANDYNKEVFNGDIGFIETIDREKQEVQINFEGRWVPFDFNEMDLVSLAYAITIHKAQGSEYPAVVIPVTMQHYVMLKRNLIYTAVTRGKKLVVLIGQKRALEHALNAKHQSLRWTNLTKKIREKITSSIKTPTIAGTSPCL